MAKTISLENISQYLDSQRFASILSDIEEIKDVGMDSVLSEMIGVAIEYVETFSQSGNATLEEMEEILRIVVKKKNKKENYDIKDAFANKILRDLNLKGKELNDEQIEAAKIKVVEILGFRGATKYHGFNGSIKENIQEQGLDPTKKLNMEDWDTINQIYDKYDLSGKKIALPTDKSRIYYSQSATNSYDYALKSPEWMARLCGGNNFRNRDYEASKMEISRLIVSNNFSKEDAVLFLKAFDNCWNTFASENKPCVVAIQNNVEHDDKHIDILREKFANLDFDKTFSILFSMKSSITDIETMDNLWKELDILIMVLSRYKNGLNSKYSNNKSSEEKISTDGAVFIDLPRLKDLQQRIEIEKQKKNQEGYEL